MTKIGFDDSNFDIATTRLIWQLNNLSHYLEKPANEIWDTVLHAQEDEIDRFFDREDGVRDIAQCTVRALCALWLQGATVTPMHIDDAMVWSEIREHDELRDWYPGFEGTYSDPPSA